MAQDSQIVFDRCYVVAEWKFELRAGRTVLDTGIDFHLSVRHPRYNVSSRLVLLLPQRNGNGREEFCF